MIAYLTHQFPLPTQTFTYDEVQHLTARRPDTVVFSFRAGDDLGWPLDRLDVRILPPPSALRMLTPLLFWARVRPVRLAKVATWCACGGFLSRPTLRERVTELLSLPRGALLARLPDVELYHAQFANESATAALVAAELSGRRFSFRSHTSPNPQSLRRKLRLATLVMAISEYDRDHLLSVEPRANVQVLRLGVQIPESVEIPRQADLVVSVGSLIDKKGHDVLIEAIRLLRNRDVPVSLMIVGEGPERRRLEARIAAYQLEASVQLTGQLPRAQTLALLAQARVCALASRPAPTTGQDGIPVALMEAMARATACVSTDISGIPELVIDGKTGLVVPSGEPGKLADALEELLADEGLSERLGHAGRQLIRERYDATTNYDRAASLLIRLAS
jgi:colanic acid/amylovoran biosynthesis glycosyltransferase